MYNQLVSIVNENSNLTWSDWLEFDRLLNKKSKQGTLGLLRTKKQGYEILFKISQSINYVIRHEYTILQSLLPLTEYCPHFCRPLGMVNCEVNPSKEKSNLFESASIMIEKEMLLIEYLTNSKKLCSYIKSERIKEEVLYASVKQVLVSIALAQQSCQFTHYDLHSNNIMMKKCNPDLVLLYILNKDTQFCIPTFGHYPVIIDYGFSYANGCENGYLWATLNHTDVGFISDRFDLIADPKLFLITTADEIHQHRASRNSRKLLNITRNNYQCLKVDWDSGWDTHRKSVATDAILNRMNPYLSKSKLFLKYEYYCIDILLSLIVLPIRPQVTTSFNSACVTFLNEFSKIENEIGSLFYCLYILKNIVDIAREIHDKYIIIQSRSRAVEFFKFALHERVNSISNFCQLKAVHFEKLLCSLYCLVQSMEGLLSEEMNNIWCEKQEIYQKVPLQTPAEIVTVIDIAIPSKYVFNENSELMVVDGLNRSWYKLNLSSTLIKILNAYDSIYWGTELYKNISL